MKDYQARSILFEEELLKSLCNRDLFRFAKTAAAGFGMTHTAGTVGHFTFPVPFSPPLRVLGEYRCLSTRIEPAQLLDFSGMLKDLADRSAALPQERYLDTGVFFSATGFTTAAQDFAWTRGIYLVSCEQSRLMQPTIGAIRTYVRSLARRLADLPPAELLAGYQEMRLHRFHNLNYNEPTALLGVLDGCWPVLLTGEGDWFPDIAEAGAAEILSAEALQPYGDEVEARFDLSLAGHALEFCIPGRILRHLLERRKEAAPLTLDLLYQKEGVEIPLRRFLTVAIHFPQWEQSSM